jgi:hypothetical protein
MSEEKAVFEVHALVELFGHQRIAGKVSEHVIAGSGFIRVDVPATSKRAGFTRFFGPSAIYGITPVEETVAQALAESIYIPDIVPLTAPMRQLTDQDEEEFHEDRD